MDGVENQQKDGEVLRPAVGAVPYSLETDRGVIRPQKPEERPLVQELCSTQKNVVTAKAPVCG